MDNISVSMQELNYNMTTAVLPVTILIGIEAVFGIFGNILILIVYSKRSDRSNFRYFVLSMALIDLTSCVTTMPGEMFSQTNWYKYEYSWLCKMKSFLNVFTAWSSAAMLLLLGFDRYRKVCRPLLWQIQPSQAKRSCLISAIISAAVASPTLFLWGRQTYSYEYLGVHFNVSICEKSEAFANEVYPLLFVILAYVLPLGFMICVVSALNFFTARTLFWRRMRAFRSAIRVPSASSFSNASIDNNSFHLKLEVTDKAHSINSVLSSEKPKDEFVLNSRKLKRTELKPSFKSIEVEKRLKSSPKRLDITLNTISFKLNSTETSTEDQQNGQETNVDYSASTNNTSGSTNETNPSFTVSGNRSLESVKQKTVIMLVLSTVFVLTMTIYVILTCFVAASDNVLRSLSNAEKAAFFFFWRLYFVNTNINPLLYGAMDPRFRSELFSVLKCGSC